MTLILRENIADMMSTRKYQVTFMMTMCKSMGEQLQKWIVTKLQMISITNDINVADRRKISYVLKRHW